MCSRGENANYTHLELEVAVLLLQGDEGVEWVARVAVGHADGDANECQQDAPRHLRVLGDQVKEKPKVDREERERERPGERCGVVHGLCELHVVGGVRVLGKGGKGRKKGVFTRGQGSGTGGAPLRTLPTHAHLEHQAKGVVVLPDGDDHGHAHGEPLHNTVGHEEEVIHQLQ